MRNMTKVAKAHHSMSCFYVGDEAEEKVYIGKVLAYQLNKEFTMVKL